MIVLGLTGSIAMGKSTVAEVFRSEGVPVFDADAAVHRLMEPGAAGFGPVRDAFPDCVRDGRIDRPALGRDVFGHPDRRQRLEAILHPLVRAERDQWLEDQRARNESLAVLDIPLLLESGTGGNCDAVVVVSASARQQRLRAMARPGMTRDKLAAILDAQMADAEKRRRADFVVPTCYGVTASRWHVRRIIEKLAQQVQERAGHG